MKIFNVTCETAGCDFENKTTQFEGEFDSIICGSCMQTITNVVEA